MKLTSRYNVIRDLESPFRIRRLYVSHSVSVCLRNDISITTVSGICGYNFPWNWDLRDARLQVYRLYLTT